MNPTNKQQFQTFKLSLGARVRLYVRMQSLSFSRYLHSLDLIPAVTTFVILVIALTNIPLQTPTNWNSDAISASNIKTYHHHKEKFAYIQHKAFHKDFTRKQVQDLYQKTKV